MLNRLLTIQEVAGYLQIDDNTVYRWCRESHIPAMKIGKEWRIDQRDLDAFLAGKRNSARTDSFEAILSHQLTPPEHILVMLTEPEKVFELEARFFPAAYERGYPMVKGCWWQHPDDVRQRLSQVGLPVADLEASGRLVVWDLWSVYRQAGADGVLARWNDQAAAWGNRVFWGSGSHLVDEWSSNWGAFLEYEERLHAVLSKLPGVLLCPCVATPAESGAVSTLLDLVPHHNGVLFRPDQRSILTRMVG
ncbi:MAG: helix-turn-helix domain-containing protein [Chloroflexota bacterium]|nr:helix-turn-helix domain-containing protein [Chloroflexota bacterium]